MNNDLASMRDTLQNFSEIITNYCTKRVREKSDRELKILSLENEILKINRIINHLKELFNSALEITKNKEPTNMQKNSKGSSKMNSKVASVFGSPHLSTDNNLLSPDFNRSDEHLTSKINSNLRQLTAKRQKKPDHSRSSTHNSREIKKYLKNPKLKIGELMRINRLKLI